MVACPHRESKGEVRNIQIKKDSFKNKKEDFTYE
jgi:hypothetical protein